MQSSKVLRGMLSDDLPAIAQTAANFPTLLFKIREPDVTAGSGSGNDVAGTGQAVCPVSGTTFKPGLGIQGLFKPGPVSTFGVRATGVGYPLTAGTMPEIAANKSPLLIVVRHATTAAASKAGFYDSADLGDLLVTGSSASIVKTGTNKITSGALTLGAAGIAAYCAGFNRKAVTDVLGGVFRSVNPDGTLKTYGATTDGDATPGNLLPELLTLGDSLVINGVATADNNNIYGIYLLAFSNPALLQPGFLLPLLAWMARNPTKGLPGIEPLMRAT